MVELAIQTVCIKYSNVERYATSEQQYQQPSLYDHSTSCLHKFDLTALAILHNVFRYCAFSKAF